MVVRIRKDFEKLSEVSSQHSQKQGLFHFGKVSPGFQDIFWMFGDAVGAGRDGWLPSTATGFDPHTMKTFDKEITDG
ncbi:hypothetical protein GCM10007385_36620 [Tateyamaria omphalii]|uniref:hypothetical protein n=1 Tax=Tateyamaria omphalii TaxID=299262 RepID=UPI00167AC03B|nr:hypothetical protein [Tateyamaria omphalii]GGX64082.1 hypothetical protein GCM10007385_36620 [Tateyamaria omphalii]